MSNFEKVHEVTYAELLGQGSRWSLEEEFLLYQGTVSRRSASDLAKLHKRTRVAIISRQVNLGLRLKRQSELIEPLPAYTSTTSLKFVEVIAKEGRGRKKKSQKINLKSESLGEVTTKLRKQMATIKLNDEKIKTDPIQELWEALSQDIIGLKTPMNKEREQKILLARLDSKLDKVRTLQDLGSEFSISKERVRQIATKGKRKYFKRHPVTNNSVGRIINAVCFENDLKNKSGKQIIEWYLLLFLDNRCAVEFASVMFRAITKVHNITGVNINVLTEKYQNSLSTLRTDQQKQFKKEYPTQKEITLADNFIISVLKKAKFSGSFAQELDALSIFKPMRNVKNERQFFSKSLEKLVQWESQGELKLIKAMEKSSIISEFVEQPIEIDYEFNGKRKYVPDFMIRTEEGLIFVLEVKFRMQLADAQVLEKAAAANQYLGSLGIGYCLVDQEGFSIHDLENVIIPEEFRAFLRSTLKKRRIVTFSDLYRFFDGPIPKVSFDQIQSLAFLYPKKIRYDTKLERTFKDEHPFKFKFQLSLI